MQRRTLDIATEMAVHVIVWCDLVSRKILRPAHDTSLRKKRVTSDHQSLGLPLMHSCTHTHLCSNLLTQVGPVVTVTQRHLRRV